MDNVKHTNELLILCSSIVDDILAEDPIDWGMLSVDEEASKLTILSSMIEQYLTITEMYSGIDRSAIVISIMAKLALENFALNLHILHQGVKT